MDLDEQIEPNEIDSWIPRDIVPPKEAGMVLLLLTAGGVGPAGRAGAITIIDTVRPRAVVPLNAEVDWLLEFAPEIITPPVRVTSTEDCIAYVRMLWVTLSPRGFCYDDVVDGRQFYRYVAVPKDDVVEVYAPDETARIRS